MKKFSYARFAQPTKDSELKTGTPCKLYSYACMPPRNFFSIENPMLQHTMVIRYEDPLTRRRTVIRYFWTPKFMTEVVCNIKLRVYKHEFVKILILTPDVINFGVQYEETLTRRR